MERNPSLISIISVLMLSFVMMEATNITTDQQALLVLKAHITHDPSNLLAKNWSSNASVCSWIGITCDLHGHRVTVLNFSQFDLTGTIPSQLESLSSLQILDLRQNQFSGSIPSSIFTISSLKMLNFSFNQLSGSFPSFLFNMSSIQVIDLTNNKLSGELPANSFRHLPNLDTLFLSFNKFQGEIPSTLSECKQLQYLSMSFNDFSGAIPKEIGNLTYLKQLYLGYNKLQGEIPQELGNLVKLDLLSLANNFLTGTIPSPIFNLSSLTFMDFSNNNLTGNFPDNICQCLPLLKALHMFHNQFSGSIPRNLWECKELTHIALAYNQFIGRIPKDIGNLTSAEVLYLGYNNLIGEIPHELSNLRDLEILVLESNNLIGVVPATIFNMSTVKVLSFFNNTLSGHLPSSTDLTLPNLERLYLAMNSFSGIIPSFILNASKLILLEMGMNSFSGFVPNTFGNLRNLEWLGLSNNSLTSATSDLSFLSSLTNCKKLKVIDLTGNPLHGILPSSIGNLSISLERFYMPFCSLSGSIPEEISNLINLTTLTLGGNKLAGSIPISLGRLQNLQGLYLYDNQLEGSIPDGLCKLDRLVQLNLYGNKLSGSIPTCLGNLTSLRILLLNSNELTSFIPASFWNLTDILVFNFSSNSLSGSLPLDLGNLKVVVIIDLSRNSLSGEIPTTIGRLRTLAFLSLGCNKLQGPIPKSFGDLTSLELLDLSNNNLSGVIPISLEKILILKYLNLSFNKLEGEIPKGGPFANFSARSFVGNTLLCGSLNLQVPPCKSSKTSNHEKSKKTTLLLSILLPLSIAVTIVVILTLKILLRNCSKRSTRLPIEASTSPKATWRRFSYIELSRATNGFSEINLIGIGSFGSVYRARLQNGTEVAVKVFHQQSEGAFKSFDVECEVLSSIRHRNLVKIISSCSNNDFKALVLEYMPNGSLEESLYSNKCILDCFQRLNIMMDVALALEYLHFGHSTPIVHCDLKPSNVLLDRNMTARISDFGIAKLLRGDDQYMTQTQTLATIGYMAPEYGREGQVSTKGDVYSYGIMLMEVFTKKKPTNEIFAEELTLKRWIHDLLPISIMKIVDMDLLSREDKYFTAKELCVSSVFSLAMECTTESPEKRINTKEIVSSLSKIRETLLKSIEIVGA